jgi:O-antigen ligase
MYFAPVIIASAALLLVTSGRTRVLAIVAVISGVVAMMLAQALAAIVAVAVGLCAMITLFAPKRALLVLPLLAVAGAFLFARTGAGARVHEMVAIANDGHVPPAIADRFIISAAAFEMFKDAPLAGAGPGGFEWLFFDYKTRVENKRPELRGIVQGNAGEAHNDHLQLLAEGGLIGYAVYAAALIGVAALSFRPADEQRARFARLAALPLVLTLAVLGLAAFPIHIASSRTAFLFVAGLVTSWSYEREERRS